MPLLNELAGRDTRKWNLQQLLQTDADEGFLLPVDMTKVQPSKAARAAMAESDARIMNEDKVLSVFSSDRCYCKVDRLRDHDVASAGPLRAWPHLMPGQRAQHLPSRRPLEAE